MDRPGNNPDDNPGWLDDILSTDHKPKPNILLTVHELLTIDWILCNGSGLLPESKPSNQGPDAEAWADFRLAAMMAIDIFMLSESDASKYDTSEIEFRIPTRRQAVELLAACPTTFRFGASSDSGFSLKRKLTRFLNKQQ